MAQAFAFANRADPTGQSLQVLLSVPLSWPRTHCFNFIANSLRNKENTLQAGDPMERRLIGTADGISSPL